MPVSLLKRYKKEIEYIRKSMVFRPYGSSSSKIRIFEGYSLSEASNLSYNYDNGKVEPEVEYVNTESYDVNKHIRCAEYGTSIYIGLDLREIKFSDIELFTSYSRRKDYLVNSNDLEVTYSVIHFCENFLFKAKIDRVQDVSVLKMVLEESYFPEFYQIVENSVNRGFCNLVSGSVGKDVISLMKFYASRGKLNNISVFNKIRNVVKKGLNLPFTVVLDDSCYKTLPDRQILPYVVYSPIEGFVKYQRFFNSRSERKDVKNVSLKEDNLNGLVVYAPWGLIKRLEV